jgi:hypothetical protein
MKKNSRIEMARDIIANLRREMDRPRLTESVRNGTRRAALPACAPSDRFERLREEQASSS